MFRAASPYSPFVSVVGGVDGTTAIQAALNRGGLVVLPPATQANPILISATLSIPSNTTLLGSGRGVTWLKQVDSASLQPMITNTNSGGAANTLLDSNIKLSDLSIDANGANQTSNTLNRCIYFVGVADITVTDIEVLNSRSDAVNINGNGAAGVEPAFASRIFVNTTIGISGSTSSGVGFTVGNRQRNASVSNIVTFNTAGHGILIDASESNWSNLTAKGAGTGTSFTNASTHTADNGGGGSTNYNWTPSPVGIYIRNVTNVTCTTLLASQCLYHGVLVVGARHVSVSSLTSANNSQTSAGVYDDLHFDLNPLSSYGETHAFTLTGATLGANSQSVTSPNQTGTTSPPTSRYGLFIADGLAGSVGDAAVSVGGSGYTFNDALTLSGGTSTIAGKFNVSARSGTAVSALAHDYTTGAGVYTVLPSNPVSFTGGTGTLASANITWSTAHLTGIVIGATVTAAKRVPSFITNWTVTTAP